MQSNYTYLLVNVLSLLFPFLFSFHRRIQFYKTWRASLPAIFISAVVFIAWDVWATGASVWGFNERYISGPYFLNLPIEEVLFFFCIPYACLFTFHCFGLFINISVRSSFVRSITISLILILSGIGLLHTGKLYTSVTMFSTALLLGITLFKRTPWMAQFYLTYLVLLIPFMVVNGILTGSGIEHPVVWYNESEITGFRVLTIPAEDFCYAIEMFCMNVLLYKLLSDKQANHLQRTSDI